MNKFFIYLLNLAITCHQSQIFERAASLTYRMIFAFFPFLIFLLMLVGIFDLDQSAIVEGLIANLPADIGLLISDFLAEMGDIAGAGMLSTALFFTLLNTSNGFRAIVRIANRSYNGPDASFIRQVGLSIVLMLLFSAMIITMLLVLVFDGRLWWAAFGFLVIVTMVVYRLSSGIKLKLLYLLPGAIFAVVGWGVVSALFSMFIQDFTQYSAIYGSIAGVFVLILWLNIVSTILLIGNEINAELLQYD